MTKPLLSEWSFDRADLKNKLGLSCTVRPSGNVLMLRHVHAYLYVRPARHINAYKYLGPAKDLVMGLTAHDQTFAFRVIIWPCRFKKQAGAELHLILSRIAQVGTWMGDPSYIICWPHICGHVEWFEAYKLILLRISNCINAAKTHQMWKNAWNFLKVKLSVTA